MTGLLLYSKDEENRDLSAHRILGCLRGTEILLIFLEDWEIWLQGPRTCWDPVWDSC